MARHTETETETPQWVEIYHTQNALEADAIRDTVLAPQGVDAVILDRTSRPFPAATMAGALYIAVPKDKVERARTLLEEAINDRAISEDGAFVGST